MKDWIQEVIRYIVKLPLILSVRVNMEKNKELVFNQPSWILALLNKDVGKDNFKKHQKAKERTESAFENTPTIFQLARSIIALFDK